MRRLGSSVPDMPTFNEGVIFSEVIGTTISLKSSVWSSVAEGPIVEELGNTFCATAGSDRQEHAINIDMISRTVTRGQLFVQLS
jgi:hypothetical protein